MTEYPYQAKRRVSSLIEALETVQKKDPEQEVQGMALPVFDAVIEAIKDDIGRDNPVVAAVAPLEASSPERTDSDVLLHNHVRSFDVDENGNKVFRSHGESGFRWWKAPLPEGWELCDCGWRPDLGAHYARWRESHEAR